MDNFNIKALLDYFKSNYKQVRIESERTDDLFLSKASYNGKCYDSNSQKSRNLADAECVLMILKTVEVENCDRFKKIYHQTGDTTPLALIKELVLRKKGDLLKDLHIEIKAREVYGFLRFNASFTKRSGEVEIKNNLELSVDYTYYPDHHYVKQKVALLLLERGSFYDDDCWELHSRLNKKMTIFEKVEMSYFESYDVEFKGQRGYEQLNASLLSANDIDGNKKEGNALKVVNSWRAKIGSAVCGMLNGTGGSFVIGVEDTLNIVQGVKFGSRKSLDDILLQIENHLLDCIKPKAKVHIFVHPIISWRPGERPFKSHVEEMDKGAAVLKTKNMLDHKVREEDQSHDNTLENVESQFCEMKQTLKTLVQDHNTLVQDHNTLVQSHNTLMQSHKVVCDTLDKFVSDPSQMIKDRASLLNVFIIEVRAVESAAVHEYKKKSYIRNRGSTVQLDFEGIKNLVVTKLVKSHR
eukprot:NODE_109_length_19684_cov_0.566709.p3 type:complete len:467 gc:universal NODE_109_length_19684_cov_0.566709:1187-2587(+)